VTVVKHIHRRIALPLVASIAWTALLWAPGVHADEAPSRWTPDRLFVQLGRASETTTAAIGIGWDWRWQKAIGGRGVLTGFHELSIGHWRADTGVSRAAITQLGFTPSLRYWPAGRTQRWFVEAGIGVNVLTPIYRTRDKLFSTAFNFGDHVAIGYRSEPSASEWSLRFQHFSNGGIEKPNPGENFLQLRWSMPLAFGSRPAP
jgi:hypothetical protein